MNQPARQDGSWDALITTPLEVVKRLAGEPVLLIGMGGSVILALIAIFGPDGGQVYAWLVAGLILVLTVIWAILPSSRTRGRRRGTDQAQERLRGNRARLGARSRIDRLEMTATGGGDPNDLRTGSRMDIGDLSMRSGPAAAGGDPPPAPPAQGDAERERPGSEG